jgi:hypothetical protein
MRARQELMRAAETGGEAEGKNRPGDVIGAAVDMNQVPNGENTYNPETPPAKSLASGAMRRVA